MFDEQPVLVSPEMRQIILDSIDLSNDFDKRLISHYIKTKFRDKVSGDVCITNELLFYFANGTLKGFTKGSYRIKNRDYLDAFTQRTGIEYYYFAGYKNRASRLVLRLPDHMLEVLSQQVDFENAIDFVTGLKPDFKPVESNLIFDTSRSNSGFIKLLNTVNKISMKYRNALKSIYNIVDEHDKDYVNDMIQQDRIWYKQVKVSERVYTMGASHLTLSRKTRKLIFSKINARDYDLQSAQLAIVAKLWDIDISEQLKNNVWTSILSHIGLGALNQEKLKKAVKTTVYSILFGMKKQGVEIQFGKLMEDVYPDYISQSFKKKIKIKFFSMDLINKLFEAREKRLDKLNLEKGLYIEGKYYSLTELFYKSKGFYPRTSEDFSEALNIALSYEAQAWEQKIMTEALIPFLHGAKKHIADFNYMHDGFSFRFTCTPDVAMRIENTLYSLFETVLNSYGILSRLTCDKAKIESVNVGWGKTAPRFLEIGRRFSCGLLQLFHSWGSDSVQVFRSGSPPLETG